MFNNRMDASRRAAQVARNCREAASGVPIATLAQAADTDEDALAARLDGRDEINVADLIGVGGYLRINPTDFLGEPSHD